MKKIILLLLVLVLPLTVYAMDNDEEFFVGDSVNVALYSKEDKPNEQNLFHVLKESKAGEEEVTLIYDGVIEGSPTVYDEVQPDEEHEAATVLELSEVGRLLNAYVNKEGAKWNVETASLLKLNDIEVLGLKKNTSGVYEITKAYSFLAPRKLSGLAPEMYNYWTSIQDEEAEKTSVFCVTYNEDRTTEDGVWATLESKVISSVTENSKCAIRPVVVVKKEYILCNNTPHPKPEKPESPDTGITDYILPLATVLLIAGTAVIYTKKKDVFNQI